MKWTEKILCYKREQYTKQDALRAIQGIFHRKKIIFSPKHRQVFELTWRTKVEIKPTVEDIVPEVDLPADLTKMKPFHETQILNYFKHLDRQDVGRRWKLISIALNIAQAKHKERDIQNFTILSNIIYKSKMLRSTEMSSQVAPVPVSTLKRALFKMYDQTLLTKERFDADLHNWKPDISTSDWKQIKFHEFQFTEGKNRNELKTFGTHVLIELFLKNFSYRQYEEEELFDEAVEKFNIWLKGYGYFLSSHGSAGLWPYFIIEPFYGETIVPPRFLYHITSLWTKSRILSKGLTPRRGSLTGYRYPPRVFLASKYDYQYLRMLYLSIENYHTDIEDMYTTGGIMSPVVIFRIDTQKLNKGTKFYQDPDAKNGVWTYTAIPHRAITVKYEDTNIAEEGEQ